MPRRSQRKKPISSEAIVISSSEDEEFVAVASDNPYVDSIFLLHKSFLIY